MDLVELNEAFSVVGLANMKLLGCRYPEPVERALGVEATAHTGLAVENELRAAQAMRELGIR